jgi:hypothetical protein
VVERFLLCWAFWLCMAAWAAIWEALRCAWLDMLAWVEEGKLGSK